MSKNRLFNLGAVLLLFIFYYWNDHRIKGLDDLVRYKSEDFLGIGFTKHYGQRESFFEWSSEDPRAADELMDFLAQYRVKRVSEEIFTQNAIDEKTKIERFEFTITHSTANPAIVYATKDVVHIVAGDYYEVVNDPIDMVWVEEFNEKYVNREGQ
ncbi:hypothetical protein [Rossellomorea aquimaris]|uniref:hypothetical protein n=1 Tax=Rossellomorea aquimaris TaxID=189382 RepID=UPI0007D0671C|nr:hypothetical protein [Rossellomorea aquimaris]